MSRANCNECYDIAGRAKDGGRKGLRTKVAGTMNVLWKVDNQNLGIIQIGEFYCLGNHYHRLYQSR